MRSATDAPFRTFETPFEPHVLRPPHAPEVDMDPSDVAPLALLVVGGEREGRCEVGKGVGVWANEGTVRSEATEVFG